jgi:hypothetical protein
MVPGFCCLCALLKLDRLIVGTAFAGASGVDRTAQVGRAGIELAGEVAHHVPQPFNVVVILGVQVRMSTQPGCGDINGTMKAISSARSDLSHGCQRVKPWNKANDHNKGDEERLWHRPETPQLGVETANGSC